MERRVKRFFKKALVNSWYFLAIPSYRYGKRKKVRKNLFLINFVEFKLGKSAVLWKKQQEIKMYLNIFILYFFKLNYDIGKIA